MTESGLFRILCAINVNIESCHRQVRKKSNVGRLFLTIMVFWLSIMKGGQAIWLYYIRNGFINWKTAEKR